jgi:hypothetical protein
MSPTVIFILGILVGISCPAFVFFLIYNSIEKRKQKAQRKIDELIRQWHKITISKSDLEFVSARQANIEFYRRMFGYSPPPSPSLEEQINQAIENEDYEEAARLRDLLKNKEIS